MRGSFDSLLSKLQRNFRWFPNITTDTVSSVSELRENWERTSNILLLGTCSIGPSGSSKPAQRYRITTYSFHPFNQEQQTEDSRSHSIARHISRARTETPTNRWRQSTAFPLEKCTDTRATTDRPREVFHEIVLTSLLLASSTRDLSWFKQSLIRSRRRLSISGFLICHANKLIII